MRRWPLPLQPRFIVYTIVLVLTAILLFEYIFECTSFYVGIPLLLFRMQIYPDFIVIDGKECQRALVVPDKAERVFNFHRATLEALATLFEPRGSTIRQNLRRRPEVAPDLYKFVHSCSIGLARKVSRVKRPHGRADNKVSIESVAHQLTQHTNLNRSQTATTGKDKSRFLGSTGHELLLRRAGWRDTNYTSTAIL
jgi:hypothetical protein